MPISGVNVGAVQWAARKGLRAERENVFVEEKTCRPRVSEEPTGRPKVPENRRGDRQLQGTERNYKRDFQPLPQAGRMPGGSGE
jgi:hypothetical protein